MEPRIVINISPLIAFARMGALDIIGQLPFDFICPQQVEDELDEGVARGICSDRADLAQSGASFLALVSFDFGKFR